MGRKGIQNHSKGLGIKVDFVNDASIEKLSSEIINLKRLKVNSSDKPKNQIKQKRKSAVATMKYFPQHIHKTLHSAAVLFHYDLLIDQPCDSHQSYLQNSLL